ncbi:hypothetical protein [Jeotgalibacillus salarius]|uniref:Uncharacterized protein n=1 Tax=Jeotgalibacillus salarius TaxID=546023 RepID=A0A4Y8LAP4_9BACL|nr:hypothetical protein [Jeotgalibacillus salarius]TFD99447.1 hypothetical protein E2626_14405 [Jeotgalibacillus salarius]
MYTSKNSYYWIYFIIICSLLLYAGYFLGEEFHLWSSYVGITAGVLVLLIIIIPLTAYLADKLMKFTADKDLHEKRMFKFSLAFMMVLPVALVAGTIYNEYREKNLTNVLDYSPEHVEVMLLDSEVSSVQWEVSHAKAAKELFDFLKQYDVKKMRMTEWDTDVSEESRFVFTIYTKNDIIGASVYENRLILYNEGEYYSVTNGPVDIEWMADYRDRYK